MLFTCLVSRAIHIEVAQSMDTDSFVNSMRGFIARRGVPEVMKSDNGSNLAVETRSSVKRSVSGMKVRSTSSSCKETSSGCLTHHMDSISVASGSVVLEL